jgi:hypothetical protein
VGFLFGRSLALALGLALMGCAFDSRGLGVDAGGGDVGSVSVTIDARIAVDSSAPCLVGMAATACAPEGLSCSQDEPAACVIVACNCVAGFWACSVTPYSCGDPCPAPGSASCGTSCAGGATGCLCRVSGPGGDLAGCACRQELWQCPM